MENERSHDPPDILAELLQFVNNSPDWEEEAVSLIVRTFASPSTRRLWISSLYSHLTAQQRGGDRIAYYRRMYATRAWQRLAPTMLPREAFRRQTLGYKAACKLMQGTRWTLRQLANTATATNLLALHGVGEVAVHEVRLALAYQGLELRQD